ncbi:S-adenosyl-L-methionine-dependent methyltransferase [Globomyces pollinis-pini]|nr:S-adenosyl-L-methionine-dependent methyltransferase [Globomyces pollinis-pini]
MEVDLPNGFPPIFLEFLQLNGISLEEYMYPPLPRFIRIKNPSLDVIERIESELKVTLEPLSWCPDFYMIDGSIKIGNSESFRSGQIYGMDVTSGIAVLALDLQPNDQVLDICCAPGTKLCYISDILGPNGNGTVTGVDVSEHRLSTCKSVMQKYKHNRIRLFCCDGTTFDVRPPTRIGSNILVVPETKRKRDDIACKETIDKLSDDSLIYNIDTSLNFMKPFHAPKLLRPDPQLKPLYHLYSKVLVDAECTHDGSVAHMEKYHVNGWQNFEEQFMNRDRLSTLETLQRALLVNGFRLLKPGGILVYSTCSFSRRQNEDIIAWFLLNNCNATLEPVPNASNYPLAPSLAHLYPSLNISHVLRFSPVHSNTSGLFIARIRKSK